MQIKEKQEAHKKVVNKVIGLPYKYVKMAKYRKTTLKERMEEKKERE